MGNKIKIYDPIHNRWHNAEEGPICEPCSMIDKPTITPLVDMTIFESNNLTVEDQFEYNLRELKAEYDYYEKTFEQWSYFIDNEATKDIERVAKAIADEKEVFIRAVHNQPLEHITLTIEPTKKEDIVTIHVKDGDE